MLSYTAFGEEDNLPYILELNSSNTSDSTRNYRNMYITKLPNKYPFMNVNVSKSYDVTTLKYNMDNNSDSELVNTNNTKQFTYH